MSILEIPANISFQSTYPFIEFPGMKKNISHDYAGEIVDYKAPPVSLASSVPPRKAAGEVKIGGNLITNYLPRLKLSSVVFFNDGKWAMNDIAPFIIECTDAFQMLQIPYGTDLVWNLDVRYNESSQQFEFRNRDTSAVGGHLSFFAESLDNGTPDVVGVPMVYAPVICSFYDAVREENNMGEEKIILGDRSVGTFVKSPVTGKYEPHVPFAVDASWIDMREHVLPTVSSNSVRQDLLLCADKLIITVGNVKREIDITAAFPMYLDGRFVDKKPEESIDCDFQLQLTHNTLDADRRKWNSVFDPNEASDLALYLDPSWTGPGEAFEVKVTGTLKLSFDGIFVTTGFSGLAVELSSLDKTKKSSLQAGVRSKTPSIDVHGFTMKIGVRKS